MSLGSQPQSVPVSTAGSERVPEQRPRSVVADLVRQWGRASHQQALENARRAATAASQAHLDRAEVDEWLSARGDRPD